MTDPVISTTDALLLQEDQLYAATFDFGTLFPTLVDAPTYTVTGLPDWLQYDPNTSQLTGMVWPDVQDPYTFTLSATDASGATSELTLSIQVSDNPGGVFAASKKADAPIVGGPGQDTLIGSGKDDVLNGGAGSDTISGGEGKDTITTGTGWDTLVFAPGSGKDVVTDFQVGKDRLLPAEGMTIVSIVEIDTNKDKAVDSTLVTFSTKDSVVLSGVVGVADAHALLVPEWLA